MKNNKVGITASKCVFTIYNQNYYHYNQNKFYSLHCRFKTGDELLITFDK